MLILAFESSAAPASVALCRDGELISQYTQRSGLTHSRTLLPMAEDLLKNAGAELSDIDIFAVAHGPGSFTGVRIGVSAVKGLAWAGEKPCVGVSTLEAMAYNGMASDRLICCAMDARRGQVYNALFEFQSGSLARICADRALSLEELEADLKRLGRSVFLVGDGAALCAERFSSDGIDFALAPENLRWQSAWGVATAARDKKPHGADELIPVYLRLSQAERERQAKLADK